MDDVIGCFLKADLEERARLALDKDTASVVRAFLGEPAYSEYATLAQRVSRRRQHLSSLDKNLIFVPGVMGSELVSTELGGVWWIDARTRGHIDDLRLNQEGTASEEANHRVVAFTTDPTYEPFLAAVLERDDFAHVAFPYDWRLSLRHSAVGLRDRISEIFEHNGHKKIHLVAHSMGGLLVRATLAAYSDEVWAKINKIVFVATPHYGSAAIAGYLKNHLWGWDLMTLLGRYLSRRTFRSLWGVLELLPAPRGIYPGTRTADQCPWTEDESSGSYSHPCANFDLYRVEDWRLDLKEEESRRLQRVLDGAAAFHRALFDAHHAVDQELRSRIAVIAGVGFKTLFRLQYDKECFGLWEHAKKVLSRMPDDSHREGDGRVSLASATLENVGDIRYVRGEHGALPTIRAVYEDVFRWLKNETMQLPRTLKGALGDHLSGNTPASDAPDLVGRSPTEPSGDDPGYLMDEPLTSTQVRVLEESLASGQLSRFNRLHIL